ncbi:E3 ubiquitin-protein ligase RNF13 (C-RZF) (RING finger protein 13) (RING-type E3 ubiquitin transferase RNF13), partial [Durusdinium trenchii]
LCLAELGEFGGNLVIMDEEANGESTFITGGDHSAALSDVTSILSQPREERLANLERFTRCITCKFCRRPAQEDLDLRKLMPDSLGRDPDVWEYTSCAICLCDFADGEELRRASCPGGHAFHPKCLRAWIERSNETCPVCRCKEGDRSKTGSGARFSADALAEFVTRRMRSTKVDFTVSKENHQRADEVMAQLFLPMVCLKPAVEEEDEPQAPSPQKGSTLVEIFAARNAARQAERPPGVASPRKSPRRGPSPKGRTRRLKK